MDIKEQEQTGTKFELLQADFREKLPATLVRIETLWADFNKSKNDKAILKKLHSDLLTLADAGGTYSAEEVSFAARKLDLEFKQLLEQDDISTVVERVYEKLVNGFSLLKQAVDEWLSAELPEIKKYPNNNTLLKSL